VSRNAKHALATALVAALAVAGASVAVSSTDVIKDRQQAMKDIGGAMKQLSAIAKKEAPFDAAVVQKNAGVIAQNLTKVADLFPEGSDKGDVETWAKPEIWSDHVDFERKREAAADKAVALRSVAVESAFGPALGELGNACKSCHETYRRPKD
jgi:cytochrome c556